MGRACTLALALRVSRCRSASATFSTYRARRGPPSSLSGPKKRSQLILPRRRGRHVGEGDLSHGDSTKSFLAVSSLNNAVTEPCDHFRERKETIPAPRGLKPAKVPPGRKSCCIACPYYVCPSIACHNHAPKPPCFTRHRNTARPNSSPHGAVPYPGVSSRRGQHLEGACIVPSRICGRVGVSS